ncbi:hypothetical protein Bdt_0501 [Bdellovibrio bacteriovorus str. Tiberius]|uniref:Glyoxalase-related protein domain-containing protein n=2 Tax=Bdellovibrio bacteriovorus TaxID=959 RepID=K7Z7C7_BDEBC|nr:hypothetical protein Bdt_0501 [Bdellovibrio bacteriovorus str. Tiberius]
MGGDGDKTKGCSMSVSRLESYKIKAKLLQKAKQKSGQDFQLKDAFALIAKTAGFASWNDLKATLENQVDFCKKGHSAYWKVWYASYDEARAHLDSDGGYLLPYQKDFFICDENFIQWLGLEVTDEDLLKVGRDWAKPLDADAYSRLLKKMK